MKGDRWVPFVLYGALVVLAAPVILRCHDGRALSCSPRPLRSLSSRSSVRATTAAQVPRRSAAGHRRTSPTLPPTTSADYLGSTACARCHQEDFDQWQRSLHIRMTKPIAEATVVGDFSERDALRRPWPIVRVRPRRRQAVHAGEFGGGKPETFRVDYTLGAQALSGLSVEARRRPHLRAAGVLAHREPALGRLEGDHADSRRRARPAADLEHQLLQLPRAPTSRRASTSRRKRYETTWTEMGIGCEACHGPGRPHVELMDAWEKNPAVKPAYDNSAKNRELSGILKIFLAAQRAAAPDLRHLRVLPRQQAERLPRLPRRRSLRGLRAAVPHQRADSRQRLPGRVLAGRPAEPVQPAAGADAQRLLQGGAGRVHELPRRARIAKSVFAEVEHHAGAQRRSAVYAVSCRQVRRCDRCDGCGGCDGCDGCGARSVRCSESSGLRDPIAPLRTTSSRRTRFTRRRRPAAAASAAT